MGGSGYKIPNDGVVSSKDIRSGATLERRNLSEAVLSGADLSGANLENANLRDSKLKGADLSGANLSSANLSGAELNRANLSGANFLGADLSGATLLDANLSDCELSFSDLSKADIRDADLSNAKVRGADLSNVLMGDTILDGIVMSRSTTVDSPDKRLKQFLIKSDVSEQRKHDLIARANHDLREAFSENGLLKQARKARVRERYARREEAKAEGSWQGDVDWILSVFSSKFTGYGVRIRPVVAWMLLLYLSSAVVYWYGGMPWNDSLYFSVVTFTTSPPSAPPPGFVSLVAGIETFAGTAAIVFLGYVLGSREQI